MRILAILASSVVLAATTTVAQAQAPTPAPEPDAAKANPVTWSAMQIYSGREKNILASAEAMPADKYSYKPTADQWTFAKIISHIAASNGALCAAIGGTPAPDAVKVAETASKAELQAALKASFDFCDRAMSSLTDAKLGDTITFFRGAQLPRARAVIEITADLPDHYSQMAAYLRLNGILPPSAQPRK
jgi:uncharacterized damage-inducible protein DinB